jgi:hypothetical protein
VLEHPGRRKTKRVPARRSRSSALSLRGDFVSQSTVTDAASAVPVPNGSAEPFRTWVRRVHGGGVITEACPSWCTATHANDQDVHLDDLTHDGPAVAMRLPMQVQGTADTMAWPVLSATVRQWPYEETATSREPYVSFEPSADEIIELDADGLAEVTAQIRAHCDRLDAVHAQLLAARAEHGAGAL